MKAFTIITTLLLFNILVSDAQAATYTQTKITANVWDSTSYTTNASTPITLPSTVGETAQGQVINDPTIMDQIIQEIFKDYDPLLLKVVHEAGYPKTETSTVDLGNVVEVGHQTWIAQDFGGTLIWKVQPNTYVVDSHIDYRYSKATVTDKWFTTPIPEPDTLFLLLIGFCIIAVNERGKVW